MRLRLELPRTIPIAAFSLAHPELILSFIAGRPSPEGLVLADLDLFGREHQALSEEIAGLPGTVSLSRLGSLDQRTRLQIAFREPSFLSLLDTLRLFLRFPAVLKDGEFTFETAARVSRLRMLVAGLRSSVPTVEVLRFGAEPMRTSPPTLSQRQYVLLHQALSAGYFDVPRRVSLTQLARKLGRSKSTISRALAVIEKELAESSVVPGA